MFDLLNATILHIMFFQTDQVVRKDKSNTDFQDGTILMAILDFTSELAIIKFWYTSYPDVPTHVSWYSQACT